MTIAFLANAASGSYDPALLDALEDQCRAAGHGVAPAIMLPDADLPTPAALDAHGVTMLAIMTGDGTINGATAALAGWAGAILVLPGGTLNLLAKSLHGDRPADAILADALGGGAAVRPIPTIACRAGRALVSMIAGPTTAWAEVREQMRQRDLGALTEAVPAALRQTMDGDAVRLSGDTRDFQAISMTPAPDGIHADGVRADGAGLLVRHALAWLGGDFRDGPTEALGAYPTLTVTSNSAMGLLMDGEQADGAASVTFTLEPSPVAFVVTALAAA